MFYQGLHFQFNAIEDYDDDYAFIPHSSKDQLVTKKSVHIEMFSETDVPQSQNYLAHVPLSTLTRKRKHWISFRFSLQPVWIPRTWD